MLMLYLVGGVALATALAPIAYRAEQDAEARAHFNRVEMHTEE